MKKIIVTFLLAITCAFAAYTQKIGNLQGIYYQAVAIDEDGKEIVGLDIDNKPLNAKTIGVRFTITKGLNGAIEWEETHTTNTDKYGLFNLIIGKGKPTGKALYTKMLDIPWIDADQFLKVEIATKNDDNYKLVSNQQFMSVPYSFYTDDIADNAITTDKILDSAILNRDIHTEAIDSRTILQETILAEDIATGAVTTSEILDSTILNLDISTSSIDSRTILNATILNEDMGNGSVDSRVVLDSSLINADLRTGAVDSRTILDASIENIDLNSSSVDTRTILNGTILNEDIADSTIDLTSKVTGVLPVSRGGTGNPNFSANSLLISNTDSSSITSLGRATDGQIPVGVTDAAPRLKVLAGREGINVTNTPDSIIISSGIFGIYTTEIDSVDIGIINSKDSWLSPRISLTGVKFGTILHGALDLDLQGCQISVYVTGPDAIQVSIFNGTLNGVDLGITRKLRLLVLN